MKIVSYRAEKVANFDNFESVRFAIEVHPEDDEPMGALYKKTDEYLEKCIKVALEQNKKVKRNAKGARI